MSYQKDYISGYIVTKESDIGLGGKYKPYQAWLILLAKTCT